MNRSKLIITIDLDWAPEAAIEYTIDFFIKAKIKPTIFLTHNSSYVQSKFDKIDSGLHPFFDPNSSHGSTVGETINTVMQIKHSIPAVRCHRFKTCNISMEALADNGFLISSNVCTDLQDVSPFINRYNMMEFPIFFEDGGFLWRKHNLQFNSNLQAAFSSDRTKVILIHPMHFIINSPSFDYMKKIKASVSRDEWLNMDYSKITKHIYQGYGIRNLIQDILEYSDNYTTLVKEYRKIIISQ